MNIEKENMEHNIESFIVFALKSLVRCFVFETRIL